MTSSTISSIALEEARTTAILGTKRRCDVVYGVNGCDVMHIVILYGFACLNKCVEFRCVYGCTVYYINLLCMLFNFSYAFLIPVMLVILFSKKIT
jgi:hypothetical protein